MLAPVSMLSSDFRPSLPLPHFNKHLLGAEHGDEQHRGGLTLRLGLHQQVLALPATGPLPWLGPYSMALCFLRVGFLVRIPMRTPHIRPQGGDPSECIAEPRLVAST